MNKQGLVEQTSTKPTSRGGTAYNMKVDGTWYGCGFDDPGVGMGDVVSFTANQNGNYWNATNVQVVQKSTGTPPAKPAASATNWDTRDLSIKLQSCRKDAIEMAQIMFSQEAIAFPAKTKAADKYDIVLSVIDELTARNFVSLEEAIAAGGLSLDDAIPAPGE